jgi:hypothetical protein
MNDALRYVLANEIGNKRCKECYGVWFLFNHEGTKAFYRLSPSAPEDCKLCYALDVAIESKSLVTMERWIEVEE